MKTTQKPGLTVKTNLKAGQIFPPKEDQEIIKREWPTGGWCTLDNNSLPGGHAIR